MQNIDISAAFAMISWAIDEFHRLVESSVRMKAPTDRLNPFDGFAVWCFYTLTTFTFWIRLLFAHKWITPIKHSSPQNTRTHTCTTNSKSFENSIQRMLKALLRASHNSRLLDSVWYAKTTQQKTKKKFPYEFPSNRINHIVFEDFVFHCCCCSCCCCLSKWIDILLR